MKKYLIRAGFDPLKQADPNEFVWKSHVGGNSGNLMFAYGVMNALKTKDTELSYTYKWSFTDEEISKINETYDAFILPMADAFRPRFMNQLSGYTQFIRRLKIPVIVIGIGLRADYEPDFSAGFPFDDIAKDFVKAVLDHSPMLGLRGGLTARYFSHLGFIEERDYTIIGCPSLYTYGNAIKTKDLNSNIEKLVINTNGYYNVGHINEFLLNTVEKFPGFCLVQQIQKEYQDMYIGDRWIPWLLKGEGKKQDKYIIKGSALERLYREDRVRYFFDVPSWINFMKSFDLFVGNRFHGTVAAVLAGLPYIMIPFNARTREMVEYHHLTSLTPDEIRENTFVLDYLDQLDFHSFEKNANENFQHYLRFLECCGLKHIFDKKCSFLMGESPLEQQIQATISESVSTYCRVVRDYKSLSFPERMKRVMNCNTKGLLNRARFSSK